LYTVVVGSVSQFSGQVGGIRFGTQQQQHRPHGNGVAKVQRGTVKVQPRRQRVKRSRLKVQIDDFLKRVAEAEHNIRRRGNG